MTARQSNSSTYIAAAAVAIAFVSGLWGLVNPRGDLADIKRDFALYATKELHKQDIEHLTAELKRIETELEKLRVSSVPRDFSHGNRISPSGYTTFFASACRSWMKPST